MNADPVGVSLLGLPGIALLWLLTLAAFGVFGWRVSRLVRLLHQARPENRFDQLGRRVRHFVDHVLLQKRIFNERSIGWPHFLIFWGFVLYATCFNWSLMRGLFPFLPIPYPDEISIVAFSLEIFAVLVLIALGIAAARRAFFPPPHLHLSGDAIVILGLIALLMVTTVLDQGFRLAANGGHGSAWRPVGSLFVPLFAGMPANTARGWAHAMWWTHITGVLVFLVYLPFSKHLHLLASPFNVFFSNLQSRGDLTVACPAGDAAAGASKWDEFTWKQLLSGFSCAECGRCDRSCPALASGNTLAPQQVVQNFKIKDARKEPVEYLWFVGDYASYDTRLEEITRTTAKIFQRAGLDFGILYEGERNAGNDVRRVGEEGLFEALRDKNTETFSKAQFKSIVTTDPHTYNTLKNEYRFEGNGIEVFHYTEVIDRLLQQGKLPFVVKKLGIPITYHDPCYLGRYNQVYEPPRRVLEALGFRLTEMPRNRHRSYCCGAGGGRIWMEDTPGIKERPSESRVREAVSLLEVKSLVVTCPKDIALFRDAVKTTGNEGKLDVKDLSELVGEAMEV